ncbi:MAG: peptidylprolyl isomerase, partial [Nitrospinae bacterium]|nr:peptidylprolyl isomerase [Nitrospinota bacterium]
MISIRVSQILTSKKEDAEKARKELDRDVPFQQVVEKYSICPSRKTGGDLGWGQEKNLIFTRGYDKLIKGKNILIVELVSNFSNGPQGRDGFPGFGRLFPRH